METKVCSKCKEEKDISEFAWKNKSKNQRRYHCRSCYSELRKRHYNQNKAKILTENSNRRIQRQQRFNEWKETFSCSICHEDDSCCLEFHHLNPTNKDIEVSQLAQYHAWEKLMQEADKCIVVCSNCHRKIHKHGLEEHKQMHAGVG